nr:MAG TPA: hypothetical protein [Caudoviricetes sp.]
MFLFFDYYLYFCTSHLHLLFIIKNAQPRKRSLSPNHLAVRFICKCR